MLGRRKFGGVTVGGVPQKEQKNRLGQIVITLALAGVVIGGTFGVAAGTDATAGLVAICVCGVSLVALVALAYRAVQNWDF